MPCLPSRGPVWGLTESSDDRQRAAGLTHLRCGAADSPAHRRHSGVWLQAGLHWCPNFRLVIKDDQPLSCAPAKNSSNGIGSKLFQMISFYQLNSLICWHTGLSFLWQRSGAGTDNQQVPGLSPPASCGRAPAALNGWICFILIRSDLTCFWFVINVIKHLWNLLSRRYR